VLLCILNITQVLLCILNITQVLLCILDITQVLLCILNITQSPTLVYYNLHNFIELLASSVENGHMTTAAS